MNAKPEAMQGYFRWKFGLVEQIMVDSDVRFPRVTLLLPRLPHFMRACLDNPYSPASVSPLYKLTIYNF